MPAEIDWTTVRREHGLYFNPDFKAAQYCAVPQGDICKCGADEFNARVDLLAAAVAEAMREEREHGDRLEAGAQEFIRQMIELKAPVGDPSPATSKKITDAIIEIWEPLLAAHAARRKADP